jgi:hypothetical protein
MAGLFGNAFTSQYGEEPSDVWRAALSGFNGEDLARGLKACAKAGGEFPPNAPTFRKLCVQYHAAAHRPFAEPERQLESDSLKESKAETAKHWHRMWVLSGLKPASILPAEEREELAAQFGSGPYKPWGDEKIQSYCKAATRTIKAGRPLPNLEEWM